MSPVALLCSEPLGGRVAGIGIRYLEMARRLPKRGLETVLVAPLRGEERPDGLEVEVRPFERGALPALLADCDAALGQGQLVNDLVLECPELPVAVDLYDPWLVENLHYIETLGLDPYRNDHATWVLQLSRGDFFVCSSEEQRLFYLGFLTALGRVNPHLQQRDPTLRTLIDVAPFGAPEEIPPHEPWLPERRPHERRLLFGGLYDWYDPWPVLRACEELPATWRLLFIAQPHGATPQQQLERVRSWLADRPELRSRTELHEWVPYERRLDLLRDVDVLVSTHRETFETSLSMRTRFLDALAVGTPVVTSAGGAMSRLLAEHDAGWVVPESHPAAVAEALRQALGDGALRARRIEAGRRLARLFDWDRALEPIARFLAAPARDSTKGEFAFAVETRAPADPLAFRLRRRWRAALRAVRGSAESSPEGGESAS